jgi:hypothetical protein
LCGYGIPIQKPLNAIRFSIAKLQMPQFLVIHDSLFLQLLQKNADVASNLFGISLFELRLQFSDNFSESSLAVAALEYLQSRPLQLDCALGEQDDAILLGASLGRRTPAASGGETWLACV